MGAPLHNAVRGERPLRIGSVDLVIVIEFERLAIFGSSCSFTESHRVVSALLGFSPAHAHAALEAFCIGGDLEKAKAELSLADAAAWRDAFTLALADHIQTGQGTRGEIAKGKPVPKRKRPSN